MPKPKRKINWKTIVRRAVQLLSFILMPGLFISVFLSIKAVYMALIGGTFDFSAMLPQILIILAVIPVTILFGRVFCGFVCAFGSLGDLVWFISRKIRRNPVRIGEKADRILKSLKYVLLVFIVVMIWTLGAVSVDSSVNPWNIFGMYATPSGWTTAAGLLTVGFGFLVLIIAGSFFIERFFCRYLCPLGAIFSILSKLRLLKIKNPSERCGSCRVCTSKCPMGIPMYKYEQINSGECIDCFQCTHACPRHNARAVIAGTDVAPLAAGLFTTAAILGLSYAGTIAAQNTDLSTTALASDISVVEIAGTTGLYADGTYTGSAGGYKGTTTVGVTVENGYITNIEVLSTDDDMQFFALAKSPVISAILESQSAQVDAVTGATYSSNAIMDAVADALSVTIDTAETQSASVPEATASAAVEESLPAVSASAVIAGSYEDGVYTGTGMGYNGEISVSVTVSGGSITDIEILSYQDDRPYMDMASPTVIEEIISVQSVPVDAVSGATFSSNGIMEAVANALGVDLTNTDMVVPEEHSGGGHGYGRGEEDVSIDS